MSAGATRHPSLDELSAWVDGEIGGTPERDALAQHVAACPSCAALVDDFRVLAGAQTSAAVPQVPSGLKERVLAGLSAEARFARRRARRFVVPLAAAATVLMGVVAVWLFRQQGDALPVLGERDEPARVAATEQAEPPADIPAAPPPAPTQSIQPRAGNAPTGDAKLKGVGEQESATAFAPAPPPPPPAPATPAEERPSMDAATRSAEQHAVAMKRADAAPVFQWKRLSPSSRDFAERQESGASSREGKDEVARQAGAAGAAGPDLRGLAASAPDACSVLDVLDPALSMPGLDLDRAGDLARRARDAGAATTSLEPAPRLTVVVPVSAWPNVQEALAAAGLEVPGTVPTAPATAGCLVVLIERRP